MTRKIEFDKPQETCEESLMRQVPGVEVAATHHFSCPDSTRIQDEVIQHPQYDQTLTIVRTSANGIFYPEDQSITSLVRGLRDDSKPGWNSHRHLQNERVVTPTAEVRLDRGRYMHSQIQVPAATPQGLNHPSNPDAGTTTTQEASTYTRIPAVVDLALLALPDQSAVSVLAAHSSSPLWRRSIIHVPLRLQEQGSVMAWDEGVIVEGVQPPASETKATTGSPQAVRGLDQQHGPVSVPHLHSHLQRKYGCHSTSTTRTRPSHQALLPALPVSPQLSEHTPLSGGRQLWRVTVWRTRAACAVCCDWGIATEEKCDSNSDGITDHPTYQASYFPWMPMVVLPLPIPTPACGHSTSTSSLMDAVVPSSKEEEKPESGDIIPRGALALEVPTEVTTGIGQPQYFSNLPQK
ncbi:hypothetical protein BU15DRAFT_61499 [Melanogaster broomeanus]|nr:hypothetical protein BU15DRAFT_61499 [Melanogaster broomeanus]